MQSLIEKLKGLKKKREVKAFFAQQQSTVWVWFSENMITSMACVNPAGGKQLIIVQQDFLKILDIQTMQH